MTSAEAMPTSARHRAREVALQALFAMDLHHRPQRAPARDRESTQELHPDAPPPPRPREASSATEVFAAVAENFEMPHAAHDFARDLVVRVVERLEALDEILAVHAKNWRVSRMAVVDRNILRLASFELMHTDTPAAVVIDEAVELARRFGSDDSPPFVNGVLDAVAKTVRPGESR